GAKLAYGVGPECERKDRLRRIGASFEQQRARIAGKCCRSLEEPTLTNAGLSVNEHKGVAALCNRVCQRLFDTRDLCFAADQPNGSRFGGCRVTGSVCGRRRSFSVSDGR